MFVKKLAMSAGLLLCASQVLAQAVYSDEYLKHVNAAKKIGALDDNLFGDSINDYSGGLQFAVTDVSVPGNSGLPVSLGRRYVVTDRSGLSATQKVAGMFGDWDVEIPHLHGVYGNGGMHAMTYTVPSQRCGVGSWHDASAPDEMYFRAEEYWRGMQIYLPGRGDEEVLHLESGSKPTDGLDYRWVTKGRWYFSCLPTTDTPTTVAGDAFLARAPDGTKYWFNHPVQREVRGMGKPWYNMTPLAASQATATESSSAQSQSAPGQLESAPSDPTPNVATGGMVGMSRNEVWVLPTRIEDRFGNWVTYSYDANNPWRLVQINGSDGRQITVTYTPIGKVATATDGTRTWTYSYDATTGFLIGVTLPDASAWSYDLSQVNANHGPPSQDQTRCGHAGGIDEGDKVATMSHPSGAQGKFTLRDRWHGRSYVPNACLDYHDPDNYTTVVYTEDRNPVFFTAFSLLKKELWGTGLPATKLWTWTYPALTFSYTSDCTSTACPTTKLISVIQPDGSTKRQTYGTQYGINEGLLLQSDVLTSTGTVLSTRLTDYLTDATGQAYPANIGNSAQEFSEPDTGRVKPAYRQQTVVQGATLTWEVAKTGSVYSFDAYANPLTVTRSSSGLAGPATGYSRAETTTYFHDLAKWVLSQVATVKVGTKTVSQTDFNASSLPWKTYRFGVLQQTFTYNAESTVATVKDGANNTTTLSSWYRGVPRTITYADSSTQKATVNPIGTLASTTDQLASSHSYGYDAMGRLSGITYPTGDSSSWNGTTRTFTQVAVAEYGIAAGHWKETVSTGNGKVTTYYDAQWRPLLTVTEDITVAASKSFVVSRYDIAGRLVFTSYPVGTLTNVGDATLKGATNAYDALGRVTLVNQDSELGVLGTSTSYLTGFQTRTTNPRGYQTTTSYQVFDSPDTSAPVKIEAAMGVTTNITRDVFGKPLTITRSGTGG